MVSRFRTPPDEDPCADPPAPADNPRPLLPGDSGDIGPVDGTDTLAFCMADVVDELRQLHTDFGMRPYRVFSVVERWSGGRVGAGNVETISEREFLPTPKVDLGALSGDLRAGGVAEAGSMRITEISTQYTEDDIRALFHVQPLPKDHVGYIEVRMDSRGGNAARRRFTVKGAPWLQANKFQWRVNVIEQRQPRSRDGEVRGVING